MSGRAKSADRVVATEGERVVHDDVRPAGPGHVGDDVEIALWVDVLVADGGRVHACLQREDAPDGLEGARGPHAVPEHALHARNRHAPVPEDAAHDLRLRRIVLLGAGAVRIDEVDVGGGKPRALDRRLHRDDASRRIGVRPRDVVRVAREAVASDFRFAFGAAGTGMRLALDNQQTCSFTEEESLPIQVEGLAPCRGHGREAHETAELQLLNDFGRPRDDDVRPSRANQVGREADGVVAGGACGRQREHHSLRSNGAGYLNGEQRGAVFRNEGAPHCVGPAHDPVVLQIAEDRGLSHGRAEDDRRALAREAARVQSCVFESHTGGRNRHGAAATHAALFGERQMVPRVELLHFAGMVPAEARRVEGRDGRDATSPCRQRFVEGATPEPDRAHHSQAGHEYARQHRSGM